MKLYALESPVYRQYVEKSEDEVHKISTATLNMGDCLIFIVWKEYLVVLAFRNKILANFILEIDFEKIFEKSKFSIFLLSTALRGRSVLSYLPVSRI